MHTHGRAAWRVHARTGTPCRYCRRPSVGTEPHDRGAGGGTFAVCEQCTHAEARLTLHGGGVVTVPDWRNGRPWRAEARAFYAADGRDRYRCDWPNRPGAVSSGVCATVVGLLGWTATVARLPGRAAPVTAWHDDLDSALRWCERVAEGTEPVTDPEPGSDAENPD